MFQLNLHFDIILYLKRTHRRHVDYRRSSSSFTLYDFFSFLNFRYHNSIQRFIIPLNVWYNLSGVEKKNLWKNAYIRQ